jgi:DNA-binding XRE family transcriptional regulator
VPLNVPRISDEVFIGLRLRLGVLRRERGMTYDDLAAAAEISRSTLVAIETGAPRNGMAVQGSLAIWYRIARALQMPLSELLRPLD